MRRIHLTVTLPFVLLLLNVGRSAQIAHVQDCAPDRIFGAASAYCTPGGDVTNGNILALAVNWRSNTVILNSVTSTCTDRFILLDNPTVSGTSSPAVAHAVAANTDPCTATAT